MSNLGKPNSELGFRNNNNNYNNKLADRFRNSLDLHHHDDDVNTNKPDFRELDLGSPVSPLHARPGGLAPTSSSSSSSSSSSGSLSGLQNPLSRKPDPTHSGELSGSGNSSPAHTPKPGHRRSGSSGSHASLGGGNSSSSANSPPVVNVLPAGNIFPSGKLPRTGIAHKNARPDVLGSGTGHYGHGSIMRGGGAPKSSGIDGGSASSRGLSTMHDDPDEMKRVGNEEYRKGNFAEALRFYDRAIALSPLNASYHYNRAAALVGLKRLGQAVRGFEEAIRLDPGYVRAHNRLGSLFLSVGHVENARKHICVLGFQPDPIELQKLQTVEKHLSKCTSARKVGDWKSVLREVDAAIASGADSSPQLFACRAEAHLKLRQLDDAELSISNLPKFETSSPSCAGTKFCGMLFEAYPLFVRAQIEMSLGRFENAVSSIEKAGQIDAQSIEVSVLHNKVKAVACARVRGNDLFRSERFTEACAAYDEGLRLNPSSSVLYCNRAACWFKLGQWERSLDDCNQALSSQPNYMKALLRRAASNSKLERWVEAVSDYEVLRRELPDDKDIAEALFHAQVGLKKSRGEEVHNLKFGGEAELVSGVEQFRAAISSSCASVVLFEVASDLQCKQISPFLDKLCNRYPSNNFLKVDVQVNPAIANSENVSIVPTFKIYKKGSRVKEMICPSPEVLESSVKHYTL